MGKNLFVSLRCVSVLLVLAGLTMITNIPALASPVTILEASFDSSSEGFVYADDTFRNTDHPDYASGNYTGSALQVALGGVNTKNILNGMSGGWSANFNATNSGPTTIELRYRLVHAGDFEFNECGQALVSVDGTLLSPEPNNYLLAFCGQGDGNTTQDSGWQQVSISIDLSAGSHTITVGGYLNQKTFSNEITYLYFDDIYIEQTNTQTYFSDDFEDDNSNNWSIVDNSGKNSDWQMVGGKFTQSVNRVDKWEQSYHLGTYAFIDRIDTLNLTDYRVSIKAKSLSDIAGLRDDIGLMLRYQDQNNYIRISISKMQGYVRIEKKRYGHFSTMAHTGRPPQLGTVVDIQADIINDVILVYINQEPLFSISDTDLASGNPLESGSIALYTQSQAEFDDVRISSVDTFPKVIISHPMAFSVVNTDNIPESYQLTASAIAKNIPGGGGIRFILDSKSPCYDYLAPYDTGQCTSENGFIDVSPGNHRLEAQIVDRHGKPISETQTAIDTNEGIGIGGTYLVMFGDSILNGVGDDSNAPEQGTQDDSANGKNFNRGIAPILNDLIANHTSSPVAVYNEGLGGTTSQEGLNRLSSTLERHTQSVVWLILFGTNDSLASINLPDGSNCKELDFQNDVQSCIGTYKYFMRQIILELKATGKIPILAKVPYLNDAPQNQMGLIEKYNLAINQLSIEHQLPASPPNYYALLDEYQDSYFFDNVHPNGIGYAAMAEMWFCELFPNIIEGDAPAFCSSYSIYKD